MAIKKRNASIVGTREERAVFNPEVLAAVARSIAQRRARSVALRGTIAPSSYTNGCYDGAALAEREMLELAQGLFGTARPLLDVLFPEGAPHDAEHLEYRSGVLVGYLEVIRAWAQLGAEAAARP